LEDALSYIEDNASGLNLTMQDNFAVMMTRTITIVIGNTAPASVNKALTVGVDYLKSNNAETIGNALVDLAAANAFANLTIIDNTNGLAFDGKVTIKTGDPYTVADWNAVVANVITAFNAAYNAAPGAGKSEFGRVFANDAGAQIVLVNNLTNNYEIRAGEFKTLYLKTGSIATADYATAIGCMDAGSATVGKATPPKHRVFLS
jgi:hypothetical protein